MQHRLFSRTFLTVTASALLASTCSQAWAEDAGKARALALRKIMQAMGKNMQLITDGLSREDWELVAKVAPLIADHPRPPLAETIGILKFIGADAGKFKEYDDRTHQAARAVEQAAVRSDGQSVISSFATLQNSCLACHQSFRKPFVEHFYGQR
jgi:cytochrome c556